MTDVETPTKVTYFIDTASYERTGRSFNSLVEARYSAAARAKLGTETQERVTSIDPKTGRVTFTTKTVRFGSNPIQVIRTECSRDRNFITPETPLMEAIFRVLLANGNQPMELDQIREELERYVSPVTVGHGFATDVLERVIAADDTYGIRPFEAGDTV